jgi:tripeptide aminopeptidase
MGKIDQIAQQPRVRAALDGFSARKDEFVDWIIAVQQIPAPTFAEAERASYVEARFRELDLEDVRQDGLHNVYGRFRGTQPSTHPPVVISAHSDTVFPAVTDLAVRKDKQLLYGPGIGDNATGVAGLFAIADTLRRHGIQPAADLWFVSNVGEEGLGDLRGMRAVVDQFGRQALYVIVEGGLFGQIAHAAVGVRRFRIDIKGQGGHSWGSFGTASAIHELGHLIAAIDRIQVSDQPKTTYNVGVIEGGTTVNTISPHAGMLLDLRSEDPVELEQLVGKVKDIVARAQKRAIHSKTAVTYTITQVGNRPAGQIPRDTPLVTWAIEALGFCGRPSALFVAGSTDANIPLSRSIPSVCVGLTESANSHRLDEYIDTTFLPSGLQQLLLLVLAASGYRGARP